MSALIDEFKREHSEILEALKEVEEPGILTKEGQAKLMSIKATLLEHLDAEDEKFYPVLWKEAKQNKKLKEELDVFANDLESVTRVVLEFFDGYDKGVSGDRLLKNFETLFIVLRNRMRNEENFLYGEFEKIDQ